MNRYLRKLQNIEEANKRLEQKFLNERVSSFLMDEEEKKDEPTKADYVSDDVNKFFETLKSIKEPLKQQKRGSMQYQKEVETFQIALILLGHPLPRHGVDGLFGNETANAFRDFAKENNISLTSTTLTEDVSQFKPSGGITVGRSVDTSIDINLQKLITNIQSEFGKPIKITSGYRDPERNRRIGGAKRSAHLRHNAVDITFRGDRDDTLRFIEIASRLGAGGIGVYRPGVIHIDLEGRRSWGPNFSSSSIPGWARPTVERHLSNDFNGTKVNSSGQYATELGPVDTSSDSGSSTAMLSVTPEIISKMVDLLKQKNIKSEDLKKHIDPSKESDSKGGANDKEAEGLIISKNNDSDEFMVVFGGTPSSKFGAKFMRGKFGDTTSRNFVFSDWENTIEAVLSKLKKEIPNARINAVVGFSKGGLRAWPAVGKYDFVGLIDPSIEGSYTSVKNVPRSSNVVLTYIPKRGWGMDGLNYAIEKLGQDRSIPVTGMGHAETPRHFFNAFIK